MTDTVLFYINGTQYRRSDALVFQPLAMFLRETLRLTGTKVVCAEGACGACTVLVGQPHGAGLSYRALNACLMPLYQAAGCHIVTVEGVSDGPALSAVQQALVDGHGAQCGFCTPGMVMTLTGACERAKLGAELTDTLCGNLCRCTGYLPIQEAARLIDPAAYRPLGEMYPEAEIAGELSEYRRHPVQIETGNCVLFIPTETGEGARWKARHPKAVVVGGATELGVRWARQNSAPQTLLSLAFITAQAQVRCEPGLLVMDAAATWTQVEETSRECFPALARLLRRFGGPQIKNAGTVGGQVVQGSPIGDALPLLLVLEARVQIAGAEGRREVPIAVFIEHAGTALAPDELVDKVFLPLPRPGQSLKLEKVSRRQGFDRSVVSAAMLLTCRDGVIEEAKLAFGGVAPQVCRLPRTEAFLQGKLLEEETLCLAGDVLQGEISPANDARGGGEYRSLLAANLLLRLLDTEETC